MTTKEAINGEQLKMLGMDVHLPCSFGDKVYYISGIHNTLVEEAIVKEFYISQYSVSYGVYDEKKKYFFVLEPDEIYFTREEAEKVVKK